MRFLLSWLKEFVELSLPPQTLADRLTLVGLEITSLTRADGDWVFEAEVTPNRPDLLSHLGIAREAAAALGRPFRFPRWLQRATQPLPDGGPALPVTIEDAESCRRYVGIVIEGVEVRPSPPELAQRLTRVGIRPVNNVVDVTNLCLLELGQPLHAFDLDTLEGETIRVRRARSGEQLKTLDGENRALSPELLVIADEKRPMALAGLMGGGTTEISAKTRRVFLESAWFEPTCIRKAGRICRLSSESSYRFERGVDLERVPAAAIRAARWIASLSGGKVRGMTDAGEKELERRMISLRGKKAQELLGIRCTLAQQRRFLERLGCRVTGAGRGLRVEPPSWRQDLQIAEDLVEEVARLWGYDRCPETLPPDSRRELILDWRPGAEPSFTLEKKIRRYLAAAGLQEIMTYSLVSPEDHRKAQAMSGSLLPLANPLSLEYSELRKTLLIGALRTVALNLNRKAAESFQLFEIGAIYGDKLTDSGFVPWEPRKLSLLMGGVPPPQWGTATASLGLFHLKGVLRFLLDRLRVDAPEFMSEARMIPAEILDAFEIPREFPVAYAEIDLTALAGAVASASELRVRSLPKIPPATRDIALVLSEELPYDEVQHLILETGKPLLTDSRLFDLYHGKQVPAGKKSLAFRLSFSAGGRTLTEEEISGSFQKILAALQKKFSAALR